MIVADYVHRVRKEKNYSMPTEPVCRQMSEWIDASCERIYIRCERQLERSLLFQRGIGDLQKAPVNCGGFKPRKAVLKYLTPFEQTAAFCCWVKGKGANIKKDHSFTLISSEDEDRVVPVWVRRPQQKGKPSPMTVILGHSAGGPDKRSPSYTKKFSPKKKEEEIRGWDEEDPREGPQSVFIKPLDSLEIHRQPHCIGALLLKSNPYEHGSITNEWRYKVYGEKLEFAKEASVELPGQKHSARVREIRKSSAGYNLAKMLETNLRKKNLLPALQCEDYREWYADDQEPFVSPYSIVKTFSAALKGNTDPLDEEMSKLFAQKLGISTIPAMEIFAADVLFPE